MDNLIFKVSMIFAVTKDRIEHYARLSEVLLGVHFVAALEEDSSNIIQLVNQGYRVSFFYDFIFVLILLNCAEYSFFCELLR